MTQDDCRQAFGVLMRHMIAEIDKIDANTPATPLAEPEWWAQMMDIQSTARYLGGKH